VSDRAPIAGFPVPFPDGVADDGGDEAEWRASIEDRLDALEIATAPRRRRRGQRPPQRPRTLH
jgi:hypothetical protein